MYPNTRNERQFSLPSFKFRDMQMQNSYIRFPRIEEEIPKLYSNRRKNKLVTKKIENNDQDLYASKPFLVSDRQSWNQQTFIYRNKKRSKQVGERRIDNILTTEFPVHNDINYVYQHSLGFKSKENVDLFKFYLRMYMKKKFQFLQIKKQKKQKLQMLQNQNQRNSDISDSDDESIIQDYETQQLILKSGLDEVNKLDQMIFGDQRIQGQMRSSHSQTQFVQKVKIPSHSNLTVFNLENTDLKPYKDVNSMTLKVQQMFINRIIEKISHIGLRSVDPADILKLKIIIDSRKQQLSQMQEEIQLEQLVRVSKNISKCIDQPYVKPLLPEHELSMIYRVSKNQSLQNKILGIAMKKLTNYNNNSTSQLNELLEKSEKSYEFQSDSNIKININKELKRINHRLNTTPQDQESEYVEPDLEEIKQNNQKVAVLINSVLNQFLSFNYLEYDKDQLDNSDNEEANPLEDEILNFILKHIQQSTFQGDALNVQYEVTSQHDLINIMMQNESIPQSQMIPLMLKLKKRLEQTGISQEDIILKIAQMYDKLEIINQSVTPQNERVDGYNKNNIKNLNNVSNTISDRDSATNSIIIQKRKLNNIIIYEDGDEGYGNTSRNANPPSIIKEDREGMIDYDQSPDRKSQTSWNVQHPQQGDANINVTKIQAIKSSGQQPKLIAQGGKGSSQFRAIKKGRGSPQYRGSPQGRRKGKDEVAKDGVIERQRYIEQVKKQEILKKEIGSLGVKAKKVNLQEQGNENDEELNFLQGIMISAKNQKETLFIATDVKKHKNHAKVRQAVSPNFNSIGSVTIRTQKSDDAPSITTKYDDVVGQQFQKEKEKVQVQEVKQSEASRKADEIIAGIRLGALKKKEEMKLEELKREELRQEEEKLEIIRKVQELENQKLIQIKRSEDLAEQVRIILIEEELERIEMERIEIERIEIERVQEQEQELVKQRELELLNEMEIVEQVTDQDVEQHILTEEQTLQPNQDTQITDEDEQEDVEEEEEEHEVESEQYDQFDGHQDIDTFNHIDTDNKEDVTPSLDQSSQILNDTPQEVVITQEQNTINTIGSSVIVSQQSIKKKGLSVLKFIVDKADKTPKNPKPTMKPSSSSQKDLKIIKVRKTITDDIQDNVDGVSKIKAIKPPKEVVERKISPVKKQLIKTSNLKKIIQNVIVPIIPKVDPRLVEAQQQKVRSNLFKSALSEMKKRNLTLQEIKDEIEQKIRDLENCQDADAKANIHRCNDQQRLNALKNIPNKMKEMMDEHQLEEPACAVIVQEFFDARERFKEVVDKDKTLKFSDQILMGLDVDKNDTEDDGLQYQVADNIQRMKIAAQAGILRETVEDRKALFNFDSQKLHLLKETLYDDIVQKNLEQQTKAQLRKNEELLKEKKEAMGIGSLIEDETQQVLYCDPLKMKLMKLKQKLMRLKVNQPDMFYDILDRSIVIQKMEHEVGTYLKTHNINII